MFIIKDVRILIKMFVIIRAVALSFLLLQIIDIWSFVSWIFHHVIGKSQIDVAFTIVSEWFFLNVQEIIIIFVDFFLLTSRIVVLTLESVIVIINCI